ncbi:MAG: heme biosynthesis HemY N-terminal domain-containing protein [Comamonadaceae bacterium]|jgi:HemY protein
MRFALWFLGLFGVAAAVALFAGNNQGTITIFWPPYRVDLSLNLVLLLTALLFFFLHLAIRALAALFAMPGLALRWRIQHQERVITLALLDAISHLIAGRFIRARKAAELALDRDRAMTGSESLSYSTRVRALAHLLAAESAQVLQDKSARETHFRSALAQSSSREAQEMRDGIQLRAARWALEDRDAAGALTWLDDLSQGASRRTLALRLRLKAARLARQPRLALETARLLAKHRAFSEMAALGLLRSLALELVATAHDPEQLLTVWQQLDGTERTTPEVAMAACRCLLQMGGDVDIGLGWLLPVWERMVEREGALTEVQRINLVLGLESAFALTSGPPQSLWLKRIEHAQMTNPGDPVLQYLAGVTCLRLQLWGKAQQLLKQSLPRLQHAGLQRSAWAALAELEEQRSDAVAAAQAWKNAATTGFLS